MWRTLRLNWPSLPPPFNIPLTPIMPWFQQNKDLVVELVWLKMDNDALLTCCLGAEEKERVVSTKNESLKKNLTDTTVNSHVE